LWPRRQICRWLKDVLKRIQALEGERCVLIVPNNHEFWENRLSRRLMQQAGLSVYLEKNELEVGLALHLRSFQWNRLGDCIRDWLLAPYRILKAGLLDRQVSYYQGVVVISTRLERWVAKRNPNLIRIPILMDETVLNVGEPTLKGFQIGFAGTVSQRKEGLGHFIIILHELRKQLFDAELQIYGKWQTPEGRRLRRLVKRLRMENRVHFHGEKSLADMQNLLGSHHLLILPRPSTLQNEYGFSTKLATYLGSGVATLATSVSDNAHYLKDGINGFLVSPGKRNLLREKLLAIYKQRDKLSAIGMAGQSTAHEHFCAIHYGPALANFLRSK